MLLYSYTLYLQQRRYNSTRCERREDGLFWENQQDLLDMCESLEPGCTFAFGYLTSVGRHGLPLGLDLMAARALVVSFTGKARYCGISSSRDLWMSIS